MRNGWRRAASLVSATIGAGLVANMGMGEACLGIGIVRQVAASR